MIRELCVPIPHFTEEQMAEIVLRIGKEELNYHFRVESFPWDVEDELVTPDSDELTRSLARISRLKHAIESYDKNWELIQIYTPDEGSKKIQVLYRKKKAKK